MSTQNPLRSSMAKRELAAIVVSLAIKVWIIVGNHLSVEYARGFTGSCTRFQWVTHETSVELQWSTH